MSLRLQDIYPIVLVQHVIETYAQSNVSTDGMVYYKLKNNEVCRLYAEMILSTSIQFNLREFEETWQLAVPDGLTTGLHQLEGMALVDRDSRPEVVRFFPVADLPEEVEERLQVLFNTKPRWTLQEISPFIEGLCSDKQGVGAMLTKYTRVSSQNGIKLYSTKKQQ